MPQDQQAKTELSLDEFREQARKRYEIPQGLWESVRGQESGGDINAVSKTGVRGEFQVTKKTAAGYGMDRDDPFHQIASAAKNLREGYDKYKDQFSDDNQRWLAATSYYYYGPGGVKPDGTLSTDSKDGVSNPAEHVTKIAKRWKSYNDAQPQQPISPQVAPQQQPASAPIKPRPGRRSMNDTAREITGITRDPIGYDRQARPRSKVLMDLVSNFEEAKRQGRDLEAKDLAGDIQRSFGDVMEVGIGTGGWPYVKPKRGSKFQYKLEDVPTPVSSDEQLREQELMARRAEFERKSPAEQVNERVADAVARGGGQISKMARQGAGAALGLVRGLNSGNFRPVDFPEWRAEDDARNRMLEDRRLVRPSSFASEVGEGIIEALPTAAGAIAGTMLTGGGLPAAMAVGGGMSAAGADWQDPKRAATQTLLGATAPIVGGKVGASAGRAVAQRLAGPTAQAAARAGGELVGGGAGNVIGAGAEQLAFDGRLNWRELAKQGAIGTSLNVPGAVGAARTPFPIRPAGARPATPLQTDPQQVRELATRTAIANYTRRVAEISRAPIDPVEKAALAEQARQEYLMARRAASQPAQSSVEPVTTPETASQVAPELPPGVRVVRVDQGEQIPPRQAGQRQFPMEFEFGDGTSENVLVIADGRVNETTLRPVIEQALRPQLQPAAQPVSVSRPEAVSSQPPLVQPPAPRRLAAPARIEQAGAGIYAQPGGGRVIRGQRSPLQSQKLLGPGRPEDVPTEALPPRSGQVEPQTDAMTTQRLPAPVYPDAPPTREIPGISKLTVEDTPTAEMPVVPMQRRTADLPPAPIERRTAATPREPQATPLPTRRTAESPQMAPTNRIGQVEGYEGAELPRRAVRPLEGQPVQMRRETPTPPSRPGGGRLPRPLEGRMYTEFPADRRAMVGEGRRVGEEIQAGRGDKGQFGKIAQQMFKSTRGDVPHGQDSFFEDNSVKGRLGLSRDASMADVRVELKKDMARMMGVKADEVSLTQVSPDIWQRWARQKGLPEAARAKMQVAIERYQKGVIDDIEKAANAKAEEPAKPVGAVPEAAPEGRKIQRSKFGEVTEAADQSRVRKGYMRVVGADGKAHIIRNPRGAGNREAANSSEHGRQVAIALKQGKPVPPEVLADYPDLQPKAAEAPQPETPPAKRGRKPRTVTHPDKAINGKEVIAETQDGRVIVANPDNQSGVSVVKDRSGELGKVEAPKAVKPFGDVSTSDESNFYGERVRVKPRNRTEEEYTGTVERVLNNGEVIEVRPDGADSSFRVQGAQIERLQPEAPKAIPVYDRETPSRDTPGRAQMEAREAKAQQEIADLKKQQERVRGLKQRGEIFNRIQQIEEQTGFKVDSSGHRYPTRTQVAKFEDAIEDATSPIHRQVLIAKLAETTRRAGYKELGNQAYKDAQSAIIKEAEQMGLSGEAARAVGTDVAHSMWSSPLVDMYGAKYKDLLRRKVEDRQAVDTAAKKAADELSALRKKAKTEIENLPYLTDADRKRLVSQVDRTDRPKALEGVIADAQKESRDAAPVKMGEPLDAKTQDQIFKQPKDVADFLRDVTLEEGFSGARKIKGAAQGKVADRLRSLGWAEGFSLEPTPEGKRVIQFIADLKQGFSMESYTPAKGTIVAQPGEGWLAGKLKGGQEVFSNGHFVLEGKPPAKHKARTTAPDFDRVFDPKGEEIAKSKTITPVGYSGAPSSGVMIVFDNGTLVNSDYFDFIKSRYKDAEFRGTNKDQKVFVFSKGEAVGAVMPMRGELPKALRPLIGKPATSEPVAKPIPKPRAKRGQPPGESKGHIMGFGLGALQGLFERGNQSKTPKLFNDKQSGDLTRRERLGRKIGTVQTMAQLLNPKTIAANAIGNAAFAGAKNAANVVALPVDKFLSAFSKQRQVSAPEVRTQLRDFADGFASAYHTVRAKDYASLSDNRYELNNGPVFKGKVGSFFEDALNIALRAPDKGAYLAAYNDSVQQILAAHAKSKTKFSLDKIHEQAKMEAQQATFQDSNLVSDLVVGLRNLLNKVTPFGEKANFGLGDLVGLKYARTPANLVARGIEYSPAGFAKAFYKAAKVMAGKGKGFDQREASLAFGRAFVGSAFGSGLGAALYGMGIITQPEQSNRGVQMAERGEGLTGYQINLSALKRYASGGLMGVLSGDFSAGDKQAGDILASYDWLQPWAFSIGMGAAAMKAARNRKADADALEDTLTQIDAVTSTLTDQSILRNIRDAGRFGLKSTARKVITDTPASFVPSLLNQARQIIDDRAREISKEKGMQGIRREALEKVLNRLPGGSNRLPERKDIVGRSAPSRLEGPAGAALVLAPGRFGKYNPHPVLTEMQNVGAVTAGISRKQTETEDQFRARKTKAADWLDKYGSGLTGSDVYKSATREEKAAALKYLKEQIAKQSGEKRPSLWLLAPGHILETIRESERQQRRKSQ